MVCISTSLAVSEHCYFSVHHLFLLSHFLTHGGNQNSSTSQIENSLEYSQFHQISSLATCKRRPLSLPCSICTWKWIANDDGHGWADRGSSHVSLLPLLDRGLEKLYFFLQRRPIVCCKIDNMVTSLPVSATCVRICQKQRAVYLFLSDILHLSIEIRHLVCPLLSLCPASCDKTSTDSLLFAQSTSMPRKCHLIKQGDADQSRLTL